MIGGNPDVYLVASPAILTQVSEKYLLDGRNRAFDASLSIIDRAGEMSKLILVWCDDPPLAVVAGIRKRADLLADAPIVLVADRPCPGIDQRIDPPVTSVEIARLCDTWRAVDNDSLDRLVATFGVGEIRALIVQLRSLLVECLDRLAADDAADVAHRVAGAAGTLGYRETSATWLDEAASPDALRIVTRRTIYRIACDLERLTPDT